MSQTRRSERSSKSTGSGCCGAVIGAFFVVVLVKVFFPHIIPFSFFEFLKFDGTLGEVLVTAAPIFIWAAVVSGIVCIVTRNKPEVNREAEMIIAEGCLISGLAGLLEEIGYRWLIFMGAIVGVQITDFFLLGFLNIHIIRTVYESLLIPVANFFTLGLLEPQLFSPLGWAVGAAIISSNGNFRNQHAYLGFIGYVNSWFIGMFMFFLMFQYGLLAAILAHFLYDLIIFTVRYVDAVIERRLGWI